MKLSEKLQTLRKKNNLTQQELANKLYISRSLYAKYENDVAFPSNDVLVNIATLFNVSIEFLKNDKITFADKIQSETTNKSIIVLLSIMLSSAILRIIFFFIPIFSVYEYVYPAPIGEHPERSATVMSSFTLLNSKSNPIGNITFGFLIVELICVVLSLLFHKKIKRYQLVAVCGLLGTNIILFFITVMYSCGYAF